MATFKIVGEQPLKGEITPQGAKNEALQVICASLLTGEEVTIANVPEICDVQNLIHLLEEIGVDVRRKAHGVYAFRAEDVRLDYLQSQAFLDSCARLRGSVMLLGPLLARFGKALLAQPGGDKIGRRRLDTHLRSLQALGANVEIDSSRKVYRLTAQKLEGRHLLLDEASITGTANVLMTAVLAEGITTIYNAACEPYIQQLCKLLNAMGAQITGIASNLLTIEGVKELHGATHTLLPDMIEVGSFIGMSALAGGGLTVRNVCYEQLGIIPEAFRRLGIALEQKDDDIYISSCEHYEIETFIDGSFMTLADAPWPGLTPDLISVMLVVATQAKGTALFHQKMFESRLFFVDKLIEMGAQIILCDPHRAFVVGHDRQIKLRGVRAASPDIRAGIALLIAALSAEGVSYIDNIEQIDRGYENIEVRLRRLGAKIERV